MLNHSPSAGRSLALQSRPLPPRFQTRYLGVSFPQRPVRSRARALQRMSDESELEQLVGTTVWTRDFERKHLAMSLKEAKDKAYDRMRQEAFRTHSHASRNTVMIDKEDAFFALKEEVLGKALKNKTGYWLKTRFPLAYELGMTGEKVLLDVRMCVDIDGDGNIHHLRDITKVDEV